MSGDGQSFGSRVTAFFSQGNKRHRTEEHFAKFNPDFTVATFEELLAKIGPCPIAGMELTAKGIVDKRQTPPSVLPFNDLKRLVNGTSVLEGKALYAVEDRLGGTLHRQMAAGAELVSPFFFFVLAAFFGLYKAPKSYSVQLPVHSVFVRKYYGTRLTPKRLELLCQQRRTVLAATTPRMMMLYSSTCGCIAAGIFLYYQSLPSPEGTMYHDTTRDSVLYYNHTEATLKWLYAVYYHHPEYRKLSTKDSRLPYYARPNTPSMIDPATEQRPSKRAEGPSITSGLAYFFRGVRRTDPAV